MFPVRHNSACSHGRPNWLLIAVFVLALAKGATLFAQDAVEVEVDVDANDGAVMAQPAFSDENFDQWLFNNNGNATTTRTRFNSQLELCIDGVDRLCHITPFQKKKLQLAGKGDIVRFFEAVEESRKTFQRLKHDQNKIGEIFNEIRPLQARIGSGLFGPGSMFDKTVKKSLSAEQIRAWEGAERARRQFQYQAKVELIVAMLDDVIVMSGDQRDEITRFILAETRPPRQTGQYDYYVVMLQLSKVPEEKYQKLLHPAQLRALHKQLNQVRGIEPFLKQQGLLDEVPEKDAEATPVPAGAE